MDRLNMSMLFSLSDGLFQDRGSAYSRTMDDKQCKYTFFEQHEIQLENLIRDE